MFALLLLAATGAWAQKSFTVKEITAEMLQKFKGDESPLKTSDLPEFKMVSVDEAKTWADIPDGNVLLLYCPKGDNGGWYSLIFGDGKLQVDGDVQLTLNAVLGYPGKVFYTALPDEWELTPVEGQQQQWSFTMRAYNVVLTPIYEPEYVAAFVAGNANTIEAGKATLTLTDAGVTTNVGANLVDGKLSPLYEGQQLTLTAAQGYKFRSVKVKQGAGRTYPIALSEVTEEYLGGVIGSDAKVYATADDAQAAGTQAVAMIAYVGSETDHATYKHGLAIALADESSKNWSTAKSTCEGKTAVSGAAWMLPSQEQWKTMFKAFGGNDASSTGLNTALATAGGDSSKLQETDRYWSSTPDGGDDARTVGLSAGGAVWGSGYVNDDHRVRACIAF